MTSWPFRSLIDTQLANVGPKLTLDEFLTLGDLENQPEVEHHETLEVIREGLADVEAGQVMPASEAIAELRLKHQLPGLR